MMWNTDQKQTGWIFLSLSLLFSVWAIYFLILSYLPPSLSPSVSTILFSHATPFHLAQLSPPQNLFCLLQTGRTELYLENVISHTTGFSVSKAEQQATNKMQAFMKNVRTSKGLYSHERARSTRNSLRMSMSFSKYPADFIQGLSSISRLCVISTSSEYRHTFTNPSCREILGHVLRAAQKVST